MYCNQALAIEQSAEPTSAARPLPKSPWARIYTDMGEEQKALDLFNEVLPFWHRHLPADALSAMLPDNFFIDWRRQHAEQFRQGL